MILLKRICLSSSYLIALSYKLTEERKKQSFIVVYRERRKSDGRNRESLACQFFAFFMIMFIHREQAKRHSTKFTKQTKNEEILSCFLI